MLHRMLLRLLLLAVALPVIITADTDTAAASPSAEDGGEGGAGEGEERATGGPIVGIDLGTTYSCVGIFRHGGVEIIPNDQGNRITPSYVSFDSDGSRLVGDAAKNRAAVRPADTIFDVKRLVGRKFADGSVQEDRRLLPYDIVDVGGRPHVSVDRPGGKGFTYAPEEISAMVLRKLKADAEAYLGGPVTRAVITVPAYFDDAQRHATRDAGIIAGLEVARVLNEPTAAAIAYGMDKIRSGDVDDGEEKIVLVFDLGGGTFDVTVLSIDGGVFQVLATNGDTHLGGSDFDRSIMNHYIDIIRRKTGKNVSLDKRALSKLRTEAERAKRALSTQFQARLDIEDLLPGYDLSETLTRAKFEALNDDMFQRTLGPVRRAMEDAALGVDEVHEIVLVGGSTRIPKVRELVYDFFGGNREFDRRVNPDEAVAIGAAIQGGILSGEGGEAVRDVILLDVAPLSLGTETEGGIMTVLIKRGTTIPTEHTTEFHTTKDRQTRMSIDAFEGERSMAEDNHLLGLFELDGIPPAPRGQMKVGVTFKVDQNGILEVTAVNKATKDTKKITITPEDGRLTEREMEAMVLDSERYAEEDRIQRERIEARNRLESYLHHLQNFSDINEDKVDDKELLLTLRDSLDEAMAWLDANQDADKEDFDHRYASVDGLAQSISKGFYNNDGYDDEL